MKDTFVKILRILQRILPYALTALGAGTATTLLDGCSCVPVFTL